MHFAVYHFSTHVYISYLLYAPHARNAENIQAIPNNRPLIYQLKSLIVDLFGNLENLWSFVQG